VINHIKTKRLLVEAFVSSAAMMTLNLQEIGTAEIAASERSRR